MCIHYMYYGNEYGYLAKIDIFKCILDLDIVRKPCYKWNNFIPLQNNGFII